MSWINVRNVVKAAVAFVVVWILVALFFDPLLRWSLVRAGQAAAGAKVDIGGLHTSFFKGRLTLRDVAVANKHEPMKNLFQFEEAELSFSPGAALRAKVVIPTAELKGLQLGTARKTSGALARSKPGKLEKLIEKQLAPAEQQLNVDASKAKNAVAAVDPKKLDSLKGLDAAQQKLSQTGDKLKGQLGVDKTDAQIKDIEAKIRQLQAGGGSPAQIAQKAKAAADLQSQIKGLLAQVQQSRTAVNQEFAGVQGELAKADDLRHKDVNGLLADAGLPTLDAESLTRHLVGPATARKISTAVYWISWIRKRSASQKKKAQQPPPARRRGIDFEFPKPHSYPAFLLEKADITGKMAALFQGRDMALKGLLAGVTSNPPLYGRPAELTMKGAVAGGGPAMSLDAVLDETREPASLRLRLHYSGLPLSGLGMGDDQLGASLKGGAGTLDGDIKIVGDEWIGTVRLDASGVTLTPQVKLNGPAAGYASQALSGIRRFAVTVGISGREDDLHFSLSSDLGQALASGLSGAFKGAVAQQRKAVEAKIDALYAGRRDQLQSQSNALQKQLLAPLDKQQAQLNDQLKRVIAQGLGRALPKGLPKGLKLPF